MAFIPPKDRVLEHSTSNSQSVFAVTGALDASYNAFSASMSVGDTTVGAVVERGVAFKAGVLTYSAANQVTVTNVFDGKGTFSASGVKEVFMGLPSASALVVDGTPASQVTARAKLGIIQAVACGEAQNLNLLTDPGSYYTIDTSSSNAPSGVSDYWMVDVQSMAASFAGDIGQRILGLTTGGVYARTCVTGTWTAWQKQLSRSDILGTVSQSGGVPTGAIIESGSNANGNYIKYADGTMICTRVGLAINEPNTGVGSIWGANAASTWTFPATFASAPVVTGQMADHQRWCTTGSVTTTQCFVDSWSGTQRSGTTTCNLMAVGRWF